MNELLLYHFNLDKCFDGTPQDKEYLDCHFSRYNAGNSRVKACLRFKELPERLWLFVVWMSFPVLIGCKSEDGLQDSRPHDPQKTSRSKVGWYSAELKHYFFSSHRLFYHERCRYGDYRLKEKDARAQRHDANASKSGYTNGIFVLLVVV